MAETIWRLALFVILQQVSANPVWQPILAGGNGRNIRHLPCVSRKSGETGTCMFAFSCAKANGTHLGTCIDRFYFGSCCKLSTNHDDLDFIPSFVDNKITDNNDNGNNNFYISEKPLFSSTNSLTTIQHRITTTTKSPSRPTATHKPFYGGSQYPVITQRPPVTTVITEKIPNISTHRPILIETTTKKLIQTTKPPTKKPYNPKPSVTALPSTTQTYQTISIKPSNQTTVKPQLNTSKVKPTKRPISITTPITRVTFKPSVLSTKPTLIITKQPTKKPIGSIRPINSTLKPTSSSLVNNKPVKPSTTTSLPTLITWATIVGKPSVNQSDTTSTTQVPTKLSTTKKPVVSLTSKPSTPVKVTTTINSKPTETSSSSIITSTTVTKTPTIVKIPISTTFKPISSTTQKLTFPSTNIGTKPATSTDSWVQVSLTTHEPLTMTTQLPELLTSEISQTDYLNTGTHLTMTTNFTTTLKPILPVEFNEIEHINMSNYKEVCGRRLFPEARIVGGDKSTFGKWPWQISLRQWRTSTYLHKCGAALLNENWAITAAHCVENVPPSDLLLRLGEHDLSTEEEPYGYQERRIQIVASHPQFDPRTFEYDLALLRFYDPILFQPNIIPICVPEDNTNFVGTTAYVTGWGRLYEDGPLPSVLQEVSVPVINNTICETMYRAAGYIEHIPDIFICAGWRKGGFDSCEGDSGGPMVIQRPDKRWLLAGIISWGIGCAEPNQPGVYTRISQFRHWINQILQF